MLPAGAANCRKNGAPTTVPICVFGEGNYVEPTIQELVINSLFVFSFIVNQPNAIKTILPAVITDSENASIQLSK
jgi:hypothetical protein